MCITVTQECVTGFIHIACISTSHVRCLLRRYVLFGPNNVIKLNLFSPKELSSYTHRTVTLCGLCSNLVYLSNLKMKPDKMLLEVA